MIESYTTLLRDTTTDEVENRYRQIIDHLPVAVYICDERGYLTEYNHAAAALWGKSPEIGKELWCGAWKIYHTDGRPMNPDACPMALTLKRGRPVRGEEIIVERPDGTRRRVAPHPTLIFNKKGEISGAVNMLEDITECREQEEKTAHFTAIVHSSDDAIISKTTESIVTSWNKAAERLFGYTQEEMIGQSIMKLIPEDRHQEEPLILGRLKNGERVDHFETKRMTKNGAILDISLTISPIEDSKGRVIGLSKIARDITTQKNAERLIRESEERFRMAVAATKMGTWEYSPLSGELNWSDNCRDIYKIPADVNPDFELFSRLIHPEDSAYALAAVEAAMDPASSGDYDVKFRIIRYNDQTIRWIRSQGKVFFNSNNEPEKFIGTVLDITEENSAKAALEQMVEERTRDLKEVNSKLAVSNNELEQFAFVASHDLQEPLRKIHAFGDMLKTRLAGQISEENKDLIKRMQSASSRMKVLIDNLLSFSRVSFKEMEHQSVNLSLLMEGVLTDLETCIKEKNARVVVGRLFPVRGEPLYLSQLFQNLIGNALKFSRHDLAPVISITAKLIDGRDSGFESVEQLTGKTFQLIEVQDNGIGFEPEYSNKIFQLFHRLHGKTDYPGSGMGLSIVQKIVKNHKGFITAVGSPNNGATFRILLPFEK